MKSNIIPALSLVLVIALLLPMSMAGCSNDSHPYDGKNPELIACAIASIPGVSSNIRDQVEILEVDPYGRTLFAASITYSLLNTPSDAVGRLFAILIMQKSTDLHVWFYGEQNYLAAIPTGYSGEDRLIPNAENVRAYFSDSEIADLKEANDWGKPPEECHTSIIISPNSVDPPSMPQKQQDAARKVIGYGFDSICFRTDAAGRKAYFVCAYVGENYKYEDVWYLVAYDKEGNILHGEEGFFPLSGLDALSEETTQFLDQIQWQDITE